MAKKPKKAKQNNPYGVPNEIADEIRRLDNPKLIEKTSLEYNNWVAAEKAKKSDGALESLKEQISALKKEIENDDEVKKLKEDYENRKKELISEEQARLEEEKKNEEMCHTEDIKRFRGLFKVAIEELSRRHQLGALK